jgi:hypothetical protein
MLLAVQLVTCFVAITMLSRLRVPMDETIRTSASDTEIVELQLSRLAVIVHHHDPAIAADYVRAAEELLQSSSQESRPPRLAVVQDATLALAGEPAALERSIRSLQVVGAQARRSLAMAQHSLAFQSRSSAWALVFLGGALLLAVSLARSWLNRTLVIPMSDLCRVIGARARGDARARVAPMAQGTPLASTADALNQVLDWAEAADRGQQENTAARALVAWLDSQGECTVLADRSGSIVAASASALDALSSDEGIRYRLALDGLKESVGSSDLLRVQELDGEFVVCRLCSLETPLQAST